MAVDKMFVCTNGLHAPSTDDVPAYRAHRSRQHPGAIWLIRQNCINPADHLYFGYPYNTGSQGFGGHWLVFTLADSNSSIALQGPWHSNADALYDDIQVDIRNKHYVQFVAGLNWGPDVNGVRTIINIVHYEEPGVRAYNEYRERLFNLYAVHRVPLHYWHGGSGGSMTATYDINEYQQDVKLHERCNDDKAGTS